jgi:hypothetical protein
MFRHSIFMLLTLLVVPLARAAEPALIDGAPVDSKIRAAVNGAPIYDEELQAACYMHLQMTERLAEPERSQRRVVITNAELEKLIEREVILAEAMARLKKNKDAQEKLVEAASKEFDRYLRGIKERAKAQGLDLDSDEKLAAMLAQQGLSLPMMRRMAERGFMAMEYMRHLIYPTVEKGVSRNEIREYYDEHPDEFRSDDGVRPLDDETLKEIKRKLQAVIADREYQRILTRMRSKATVQILQEQ